MNALRHHHLPAAAVMVGLLGLTAMPVARHDVRAVGVAHVKPAVEYGYALASSHLSWIVGYGVIAAVVAVVALLVAQRTHAADGARRVPLAMAAGTVWPVFVIALAQLGTLAALRYVAVRGQRSLTGA